VVKINPIFKNPLGYTKGIFYLKTFLFILLSVVSLSSFSQAKMEITEAKKNFGFVKRGEIIRNEFEISNTGNSPLIITDIEISCSCTTAEFSKQPILPGQKSKIIIIFNTTTVYGRQDRIVYVNSNDPKGPYKLRYKGNVSNK